VGDAPIRLQGSAFRVALDASRSHTEAALGQRLSRIVIDGCRQHPTLRLQAICEPLRGIFSFGLVVAAPREAWMGREGLECLHQRVRYASGKMSSL
jgi:hypothetical protein